MKTLCSITLGLFLLTIPAFPAVLDTIDAVVNGELILSSEVDNQLRLLFPDTDFDAISPEGVEKIRLKTLQTMIDGMLLVQEAKKSLNTDQTELITRQVEQETNQQLEEYKVQRNLTTPEALALEEKRLKLPWEEFRRLLYLRKEEEYLIKYVVTQLNPEKPKPPTQEEIQQYLRENPDAKPNNQILIAHILLKVPAGASPQQEQAILQLARDIANRARAGEPFEQLVQKYSEHEATKSRGGMMPIRKGELYKELDQVFNLKEGEISDPIRTPVGYHIVKVLQIETVADLVMRQKREQAGRKWIQELRKKAKIEIRQGNELKPLVP